MFDCARGEEYRTNTVGNYSHWLSLPFWPFTFDWEDQSEFQGEYCLRVQSAIVLLSFYYIFFCYCFASLSRRWLMAWLKRGKRKSSLFSSCSPSSTDTVGEEGPSVEDASGRLVVDPAQRGDPVCALWCAASSSRYFVSYLHSGKSTHSAPL